MDASTLGTAAQQITTPMALAAVVLMLAAPIIQQILKRRGKPNRDTRLVLRGVFILGLVFGLLAFASYLYGQFIHREIRVSGAVRDEAGAGIAAARVAIDGRDSGSTDAQGDFAFTIPASRSADSYTVRIFREGYSPETVSISGANPPPLSVVLKRPPLRLDGALNLASSMVVRHYLGVPSIEVALSYSNPLSTELLFTDIGVTLESPAGRAIPMMMEGVSVIPGRFDPPLTQWNLAPNGNFTIDHFFFNPDAEFFTLQQRVFTELAPHSAAATAPNPQAVYLGAETVSTLRQYMNAHFIWTPGTWKVKAHARARGQYIVSASTFVLDQADVDKMRAIANFYPSALGVAPNWRFWGTADANPVLTVSLGGSSSSQ